MPLPHSHPTATETAHSPGRIRQQGRPRRCPREHGATGRRRDGKRSGTAHRVGGQRRHTPKLCTAHATPARHSRVIRRGGASPRRIASGRDSWPRAQCIHIAPDRGSSRQLFGARTCLDLPRRRVAGDRALHDRSTIVSSRSGRAGPMRRRRPGSRPGHEPSLTLAGGVSVLSSPLRVDTVATLSSACSRAASPATHDACVAASGTRETALAARSPSARSGAAELGDGGGAIGSVEDLRA